MHITRKKFDHLLVQAIASLPEQFARWIDEIPIIVEDRPPKKSRGEAKDVVAFYQGVSLPNKEADSGHLPPRIVIYRRPLMQACHSLDSLAEEIRKTLLHELGHHAGMDEEQLDKLGYGPLKDDENDENDDQNDDKIDWDIDENPSQ